MFLQAIAGFLIFPIFILLLRWTFPTKKDTVERAKRRELKRELRELKRR